VRPPLLLAQETTTTEAPRIVGEPLAEWVVIAAGLALLVVILVAGALVRHRSRVGTGASP
jgi:hypothetical protein